MCVKDIVELDSLVKRRLINLAEKNNLDLNSLVERLIDEREVYEEKLKNIKEEYEVYKIRDITALKIGDAIMDGICVTDGDGNIIDINKGYTKITGLTKKDLIGLNVEKFLGKKCYDMEVTFEVLKKKRKISKMSIINNKQLLIIGNPFFNMDGQ